MTDAPLDRVWARAGGAGSDTGDLDVLAWYEESVPTDGSSWVRMNFVASVDGAVTVDGLSGGLGSDADHRVFDLLRVPCDVVVVAAGTVRAEGYGALRVDDHHSALREGAGFAAQPRFGIVSRSLDLDPDHRIFTEAPVRPVVITTRSADRDRVAALSRVADVYACGDEAVDGTEVREVLALEGMPRIHSEGGPALFGAFIADGAVDDLCLTVSPLLAGGDAGRIAHGRVPESPVGLSLAHIVRADDTLLLRYTR
ncbi:pyrimidine reductase family protein [Labedella endophytica]|uniref:Pyrimidine reductase family protein n=1 Tax=Labedella endophytica TaxID=1523160 RepID=A0A3S0V9B1_9MICO|nr:pyrimidine reductase family protein [Labedella endophytica]RUQ99034.1 pyrimidine reductase family protein [Labedella endophytica]